MTMLAEAGRVFPEARPTIMWAERGDWPFQGATYSAPNPPRGTLIRYYLRDAWEAPMAEEDGEERSEDGDADEGGGDGPEDEDSGQAADGGDDAAGRSDADSGQSSDEDAEAAFALTITDAEGNHVRTLEAPAEAGINEVVWDWRFDAPYEADGEQGGGGGGPFGGGMPQGPIALPGAYTVSMDEGGETFSSTVEIQADPRRPMTMADRRARQDALMSLHRLAVPIHEATEAISRLEEQLDGAEELIGGADDPPEGIGEELEAIREALEGIEEDVSEARRNAGVANAIQRSSTLPTEDHLWQVDHAWEVMGETVPELNELIRNRVPDLNAQLYAEGVRPDSGDAVEMPER